jgi:tetratricopeptide (TPR) repeat protein
MRPRVADLPRPGTPVNCAGRADVATDDTRANPHVEEACRRGRLELKSGVPARAIETFEHAIALDPACAEAHFGLGAARAALGDVSAALQSVLRAVEIKHDYAEALFFAGRLHDQLGQQQEAIDCFQLALVFDPRSSASRLALARRWADSRGPEAAILLLQEAVDAEIADCAVYCELARRVNGQGDTESARKYYEAAIAHFPDDPAPAVNLGLLHLAQLGNPAQAETLLRSALAREPGLIEAAANLGLALHEQGRFEDALRLYAEQLDAHPGNVELRWHRGLACLARGDLDQGWPDYEMRKRRAGGDIHREYAFPDWDGSDLRTKNLLVYGEQGLGDEIMFASCLPDVVGRAKELVVECDVRLVELFQRSFPAARVEARRRAVDRRIVYPHIDVQIAMGSLPGFLRNDRADFPLDAGYLVPDPDRVDKWRDRLARAGASRKVGISWRGGTFKTRSALRSADVRSASPLWSCPGTLFVDLQSQQREEERAWLDSHHPGAVMWFPEAFESLDELAALIWALDLVVSVPTSTAHLSAALGKPTWILLTASPEWRYSWDGEGMLWYPSARLFRQPRAGDWAAVMDRVDSELRVT